MEIEKHNYTLRLLKHVTRRPSLCARMLTFHSEMAGPLPRTKPITTQRDVYLPPIPPSLY